MDVSRSPELAVAPALRSEITDAAALHKKTVMGSFGKVSPVTGWRAFFRGEFFGHGRKTTLTGSSLLTSIASTHGQTIADKVGRQLGLSGRSDKPINSYKVAKAVALVEAESGWTKPHTTEISYVRVDESGKAVSKSPKCKVTLTPLGCLKSLAKSPDLFGVASTDTQNKNAVNAWVEQMHIGDSNAAPTTSFVRSGMLVPPSSGDEGNATLTRGAMTKREETALNRYKQILSAIVETTPSLIPKDFNESQNNETTPLEIEHAHIGLLSINKKEEAAMATDQMAFIRNQVHDKPIQIDYVMPGTKDVIKLWVKPKVLYTNFSVQKASKTEESGEAQPLNRDQNSPDAETEKTLDHYLGTGKEAGALAKKIATFSQEDQKEPEALLSRLIALRQTRSQEGSSFYSYEFQTKYSLLLNQCGIPTHVYCKSGKDRTSRFSEMIKMWAANPTLKLNNMTPAVRNVIKAFSFSGNSEVQRLNTGFAGNKQFKTYWRLIAGEKNDLTFGGWTHWLSAGSYSGWGASTIVKT